MEQKTLFELPIYAMSEKEFNKRWAKQKNSLYEMYIKHGHSDEDTRRAISNASLPRCLWKYNQIIGYIKISVSKHDVWFDIYCSLDKKFYADSEQKHFIQKKYGSGTHFYLSNPQDKIIKEKILEWLKAIEKEHLRKSFYVDYSTFDNIINYVNIEQIMKSM